jgi:2-hydroxychromene-2-carboxylate isomerase
VFLDQSPGFGAWLIEGPTLVRQSPGLARRLEGPMQKRQIDFWFTMGSTYTYLTVMRINQVQRSHGVVFRWRPFDLLTILKEMKHVPFADKPNKMAYMWRDIERRAALRGIPFNRAAPYPLRNSTLANRVALVGLQEGWGEDFIRASYRRWFLCNEETGSEPNLSNSLDEAGQDRLRVVTKADSAETLATLAAETDAARGLGIFGSPTFAFGQEIFWGDDRLEDAVNWCLR